MKYVDCLKSIAEQDERIKFRKDIPIEKLGSALSGEQGAKNQAFATAELHEDPSHGNSSLPEGTRQPAKDPFVPRPSPEMEKEIDEIINGSMKADILLRSFASQLVHFNPLENPKDSYKRAIYEAIRAYPDIFRLRATTKLSAEAGQRLG